MSDDDRACMSNIPTNPTKRTFIVAVVVVVVVAAAAASIMVALYACICDLAFLEIFLIIHISI
jgi:cytochrome c oxidase assembly protein Cox11